mmetsp:Transcript_2719/g.10402  ORF Transcript_2719/g.10402 Transcript_2719/m.10402 type:complete len:338 (-) Transcript_2719:513-1526(-)
MSPAKPTSRTVLSWPKSALGRESATCFFVRAFVTFMPRSNLPETTRTNATLSRCLGSMFACSLNTNPQKFSSVGCNTEPSRVILFRGFVLYPRNVSKNSFTPKLFPPLPKKTGVSCPSCTFCRSNSAPNSSNSSMSSTNCSYKLLPINPSKRASLNSTISNPFVFLSSPFFVFPALASLENKCTSRVGRWNTPWNVSPLPIGQFTAYVGRENSRSIWSNNSSGSRDGRSILLQNVKMGNPFNRQTSKSFRVCGSNPFAESISITALSAAVTVRYVSSLKSTCPGVSRRFSVNPAYWKLSAVLDIEIPRCCSISIQSDVAAFAPLRDRTAPASLIAPP